LGIYPREELGWRRNVPRERSWGSPRGNFFIAGTRIGSYSPTKNSPLSSCRRFDPGGSLDRRVNCHRVSQPRWVGARRSTKGGRDRQKGNPAASVLSCAQVGCACSRGYKRPRGRERDHPAARSPARPTFSYESPGPSFYRRKERVQVYNGGCSSVLTCLVERS
jgi:hypothetical protein